MNTPEEIEHKLKHAYAEFLIAKTETMQQNVDDVISGGMAATPGMFEGIGNLDGIPEEHKRYMFQFFKEQVVPYVKLRTNATFYAVATILADLRKE